MGKILGARAPKALKRRAPVSPEVRAKAQAWVDEERRDHLGHFLKMYMPMAKLFMSDVFKGRPARFQVLVALWIRFFFSSHGSFTIQDVETYLWDVNETAWNREVEWLIGQGIIVTGVDSAKFSRAHTDRDDHRLDHNPSHEWFVMAKSALIFALRDGLIHQPSARVLFALVAAHRLAGHPTTRTRWFLAQREDWRFLLGISPNAIQFAINSLIRRGLIVRNQKRPTLYAVSHRLFQHGKYARAPDPRALPDDRDVVLLNTLRGHRQDQAVPDALVIA